MPHFLWDLQHCQLMFSLTIELLRQFFISMSVSFTCRISMFSDPFVPFPISLFLFHTFLIFFFSGCYFLRNSSTIIVTLITDFFLNYFLLEYSWFTMCLFLLYTKWIIYIYPLYFRFYSDIDHYRVLRTVPVLYTRSLLVIFFMYIVVYICQFQSPSLSLLPPPLVTIRSSSMSVTVFLFCKWVHLCQIFFLIPHISDIIWCLFFSDISLSMTISGLPW